MFFRPVFLCPSGVQHTTLFFKMSKINNMSLPGQGRLGQSSVLMVMFPADGQIWSPPYRWWVHRWICLRYDGPHDEEQPLQSLQSNQLPSVKVVEINYSHYVSFIARHYIYFWSGSLSGPNFSLSLSNHVGFMPWLLKSSAYHSPVGFTHLKTGWAQDTWLQWS